MIRLSVTKCCLLVGATVTVAISPASALAKVVTLQHDVLVNNAEAVAVCGFAVGEKFAASFTPPAYPARLLKARLLLTNVNLSVSPPCTSSEVSSEVIMPLEVFHKTGAAPGTSFGSFDGFTFSNDNVLNEIDVASSNMTIQDGAFFLAYSLTQSNASPVHDNSNAGHNDLNFIYADLGLGWNWYSFAQLATYGQNPKGDWVIRIDVDVPDDPPDGGTGGAGGTSGGGGTAGAAGASETGGSSGTGGTGGTGAAAGGTGGVEDAGGGTGGTAPSACVRDNDCEGGQVCDTTVGRCIQVSCTIDSECDGGYVCRDKSCRKICSVTSDCKGGETCSASGGIKVCMPDSPSTPSGSEDDGGCAMAPSTDRSNGWLVAVAGVILLRSRRRRT